MTLFLPIYVTSDHQPQFSERKWRERGKERLEVKRRNENEGKRQISSFSSSKGIT